MENLRKLVNEIAFTQNPPKVSPLRRSLIPLLSVFSSLYALALSVRHRLYLSGVFPRHRLPVPVISVGNLTWGGNGKTPMVEFITLRLASSGISPLILTRGYGGGDEASMLQRHLIGTSAKIGVGANRAATASFFLQRYGYMDHHSFKCYNRLLNDQEMNICRNSDKIGVVILDDGMQHLSLCRDLEIVMVNGLCPWGNCQLIPRGPLREPLIALERADVTVVHHADLASEQSLKDIESTILGVKGSLPIFFSRMFPSHFFSVGNIDSKIPLDAVQNKISLCVSAIGFSDAFVQRIEKLQPLYMDRLDFSDHHLLQAKDVEMIRTRLRSLEDKHCSKPIVVVTEKDYDRDPEILSHLNPFVVLVLCSCLQIIPYSGRSEEGFIKLLFKQLSKVN